VLCDGKERLRGRAIARDIGFAMQHILIDFPVIDTGVDFITEISRRRKNPVSRLIIWLLQRVGFTVNRRDKWNDFDGFTKPSAESTADFIVEDMVALNASTSVDLDGLHGSKISSTNVIGQARRCQASNLIRRLPRRRLLRLIRSLSATKEAITLVP